MESSLKKTKNWYRCVGVVSEKSLKLEDCEVKIYEDGHDTGKKVKAECIKGNVAIHIPGGVVTFNIYFASKGLDGKENPKWAMAKAMLEKWNPEIGGQGDVPATVVGIEGSVEPNDYVDNSNALRYSLRYRVSKANTRVSPEEPHGMTISATTYIKSIRAEEKNQEETGRLLVDLYGVTNKGACYPINAVVEEDLAGDFEDMYEAGQTVPLDLDVVVRHVGGKQETTKKAFGRGGAINTNNGFDVTELMIVGADPAIEEPDELTYEDDEGNVKEVETDWINPKTMNMAFKERAKMLEELEKKGNSKGGSTKSNSSLKQEKAERKLGRAKQVAFEDVEDDDELPF